jgi:hypothetical protein
LNDLTLRECQLKCDETEECVGIEYFRPSGDPDAGDHFKEGDCTLSSSQNLENCNPGYH